MYIHGSFYNQKDERITVYILTKGDRSKEVVIGTENGDLYFSADPVEIKSQVNDTFDHLLLSQASIRLLARNYMEDFFCSSCRDAIVNVYREGVCLFAGYVEPQTFSQDYNEELDEVELTCIDALSALKYSKYKDVGALGVSYAGLRRKAEQRTFYSIMDEVLSQVMDGIHIRGGNGLPVYYDGSKAIDSTEAHRYTIFQDISISELLFLGDSEDDVWTHEDVLTELLRYLNLHILQDGLDLYIFSWESMRDMSTISWKDLRSGEMLHMAPHIYDITTEMVTDCNTQISVSETYNQLLLTDKVEEIENVVESPLDSDSLQYAYDGMQKYMTEYSAGGEGKTACNAICDLTHGTSTTYDAASITDWYVQVRKCANWTFFRPGKVDIVDEFCKRGVNQQRLPDYLGLVTGAAAILSVGKVQKNNGGNDNSPISTVNMTDYLVISVNGNGKDGESECYPTEQSIRGAIPCAEYNGNKAGGVFSPSDNETTNYIVVSGSMVMNPLMPMTASYTDMRKLSHGDCYDRYWHHTVRDKNGVRYYTRQHWKATSWRDEPTYNEDPDIIGNPCFIPYTGEGPQEYEFRYSAVGDSTDTLSKVGVIACMLIIGDKCVVEKKPGEYLGTGTKGTGNGQLSDFVWQKYRTREECGSDDEYYQQSFTIGFDPKIGDKIIGTEYKMQNNLSYTDGVDAEGIGIPIRKGDKVSGVVKFMILGPVNSIWNDVTRRHPTFFRHTKWTSNSIPLLAHTSCILVKELEVKVYSDNGKVGSGEDGKDIVYMSDTKETFVNKKDDLEFRMTTALTSTECKVLGVKNSVNLSTPLCVETGDGLLGIYDRHNGEMAKPEQHYVDAYWREWHEPRVVMEQSLEDGLRISPFHHYRHPAIGKTFHVQDISRNLEDGSARLTMKELF